MLAPKRIKFRKTFKGKTRGIATRGNTLAFGEFGLMCLEPGWITNRQIEASRVAMTREMKRGGKVWIRIFPDKRILFEIDGVTEDLAKKAFALASAKLPVKTRIVRRTEM
jgi:large subunit ribosomal protein L16